MTDFVATFAVNMFSVIVTVLVVLFVGFKWRYQHWKRKNVPYVEPTIPFGNIGGVSLGERDEKIRQIYKMAKLNGWRYCGLFTLLTPTVLVVEVDLMKRILATDFQYFSDRGEYTNEKDDPVGCTMFALSGTKWKTLRSKISPAFTPGKMKGTFQILAERGVALQKYIEETVADGEPVNVELVMQSFSTDVIGSYVLGIECNSFEESDSVFRQFSNKYFSNSKLNSLVMTFAENFPTLSRALRVRRLKKEVAQFFLGLVRKTVAYREENNYVRKDFLQMLIDMKNNKDGQDTLNMNEISAQILEFFTAGSETSASTLSFTLFELASHPEVQDRVRKEILTVLARHDNKVTYDAVNEMKYMGQVMDETLRLYTPARALERNCVQDYKIPGEDVILEKGTKVILPLTAIHLDEDYWHDPKTFDPDRFSIENRKDLDQWTSMPFGQGPRICVGERFARTQVKVGLTSILRKFRVTLNEKTKVPLPLCSEYQITTTRGNIWLNIEKI